MLCFGDTVVSGAEFVRHVPKSGGQHQDKDKDGLPEDLDKEHGRCCFILIMFLYFP